MQFLSVLITGLLAPILAFAAPADVIQSGQNYKLINVQGGTAIDLSAGDHHTIMGYPYHNGTNQQWTFTWAGDGWTIKSVSDGQYLGLAGPPENNVSLAASAQPFTWHIWKDDTDPSVYRLFAPNTTLNVDLSDHGESTPGARVILWWRWSGKNQVWNVSQV